jgi:hypothetical protein
MIGAILLALGHLTIFLADLVGHDVGKLVDDNVVRLRAGIGGDGQTSMATNQFDASLATAKGFGREGGSTDKCSDFQAILELSLKELFGGKCARFLFIFHFDPFLYVKSILTNLPANINALWAMSLPYTTVRTVVSGLEITLFIDSFRKVSPVDTMSASKDCEGGKAFLLSLRAGQSLSGTKTLLIVAGAPRRRTETMRAAMTQTTQAEGNDSNQSARVITYSL